MPYFETELDIDVDEFISSCSQREIKEIIETLQEDGYIRDGYIRKDSMNFLDEEWLTVTNKLNTLRLRLSLEEELSIKEIVNRY